jgi:hypothetical protein
MGIMKRLASIILTLFFIITGLKCQTSIPNAQAMFIYNFSRLIEWPANYKSGPFVIGVLGSCETLTELQNYTANKAVGSQQIMVKKFESAAEIGVCHILFVPFSKTKLLPEITQALGNKSTLIICEKNGAIEQGAAINFVVVADKLKFEVKPSNATSKSINMSSKLSEMAIKTY